MGSLLLTMFCRGNKRSERKCNSNGRKAMRAISTIRWRFSTGPKHNCLNVGALNLKEKVAGKRHFLATQFSQCCSAVFIFLLVAVQLFVKMTSAWQKSECCSATSAAEVSENCSATSVFACGMLQGWGLKGWGLGLTERC